MPVKRLSCLAAERLIAQAYKDVDDMLASNVENANTRIRTPDRTPQSFRQWIGLALKGLDFHKEFLNRLSQFALSRLDGIERRHPDWANGELFDVIAINMETGRWTTAIYGDAAISITNLMLACVLHPTTSVDDTLFDILVERAIGSEVSTPARNRFRNYPPRIFEY